MTLIKLSEPGIAEDTNKDHSLLMHPPTDLRDVKTVIREEENPLKNVIFTLDHLLCTTHGHTLVKLSFRVRPGEFINSEKKRLRGMEPPLCCFSIRLKSSHTVTKEYRCQMQATWLHKQVTETSTVPHQVSKLQPMVLKNIIWSHKPKCSATS